MGENPLLIAITGASGAIYALRFLQKIAELSLQVELILSATGRRVFEFETDLKVDDLRRFITKLHREDDFFAPPASGSTSYRGMIIIPCSMGTLSAIAQGISLNLIHRAADVMLKERKPLVLVVRETPLSSIHLENMLRVTQAGGIIYPAMPAFYTKPTSLEELIEHFVEKLLALWGFKENPYSWGKGSAGYGEEGSAIE